MTWKIVILYLRLSKIVRGDFGDLEVERLGTIQLHGNRSLLVLQDSFHQ